MKKILVDFLLAVCILSFYMLFGLIISSNHEWLLTTTVFFTFIVGYYIYNTKGFAANRKKFFLFVLPLSLLFLGSIILQDDSFVRGFPYLIFIPFASFTAIIVKQKKTWWSILIAIPISCFIGFVLFPNWFSFHTNYNSHVNRPFPTWELIDEYGENVTLEKDKIIILDLWNKYCGVCIRNMPTFENEYLKYKSNSKISFYSVYVPLKENSFLGAVEFTKNLGYSFPTIYSKQLDSIIGKKLGYHGYPQLFILKDGKIRYSGDFITNPLISVHSLENEIERLLK